MYSDKQLREIFHFLFLDRLFQTSDPGLYSIKGGVNLRFFYGSPRYSEDMDLDVFGGAVETLKKNGYKIIESPSFIRLLKTFGVSSVETGDIDKAKHTETTQRFKVHILTEAGDRFPTKVEFSRRQDKQNDGILKSPIDPEIASVYKRPNFLCPHYSPGRAVQQKVEALAGRTEPQTRDLFDLYLLLTTHVPGFKFADPAIKKTAIENLMVMDYQQYRGQVVEFLEPDAKARYGSDEFWSHLQDFLLEKLQNG